MPVRAADVASSSTRPKSGRHSEGPFSGESGGAFRPGSQQCNVEVGRRDAGDDKLGNGEGLIDATDAQIMQELLDGMLSEIIAG
jgi:hypothetical protein